MSRLIGSNDTSWFDANVEHDFWTALKEGDSDLVVQYIIATVIAILVVWITTCSICCACHTVWFSIDKTTELFCSLFRTLYRCLTCFCRRRRPDDNTDITCLEQDQNVGRCDAVRVRAKVPFCQHHWRIKSRAAAVEAVPFESPESKFTVNLHYKVSIRNVLRDVQRVDTNSDCDGLRVYQYRCDILSKSPSSLLFYKLCSVLPVDERHDYQLVFEKANGRYSMALTFALLINERFVRFNCETGTLETDWVLTSLEVINRTIVHVSSIIDREGDANQLKRICDEYEV